MPIDPSAPILIAAFRNTPGFAHGQVRDLRIRWALEEIGRPYRVELLDAMAKRPAGYRDWQPFGQVPAFDDGTVRMFESGAILLYLGEQDERLLPRTPQPRATATAWLIAALNSVEPPAIQIITLDVFQAGQPWAIEARPSAVDAMTARLASLSKALGDSDWLGDAFSVADIAMVTVLRILDHTDLLADYSNLAAYKARAQARPAFQTALADQLAGLGPAARIGS